MINILMIEDDAEFAELLTEYFTEHQYSFNAIKSHMKQAFIL